MFLICLRNRILHRVGLADYLFWREISSLGRQQLPIRMLIKVKGSIMCHRLCRSNKYLLWVNFKNRCCNKTSQSLSLKACQLKTINWKRPSKINPNSLSPQPLKETNATSQTLNQTKILPMKAQKKTKPNQTVLNAETIQRPTTSINLILRQPRRTQKLKTKMIRQKKKGASITMTPTRFRSWKVWTGWVALTRRMKSRSQSGSQPQKSKSFNSSCKRSGR